MRPLSPLLQMTTTVPLLSISDDNLNTHSYALCQDRQTYRSRLFKYPIEARFNKRKDNSPDISVDIAAVVLYEDFEYTGELVVLYTYEALLSFPSPPLALDQDRATLINALSDFFQYRKMKLDLEQSLRLVEFYLSLPDTIITANIRSGVLKLLEDTVVANVTLEQTSKKAVEPLSSDNLETVFKGANLAAELRSLSDAQRTEDVIFMAAVRNGVTLSNGQVIQL